MARNAVKKVNFADLSEYRKDTKLENGVNILVYVSKDKMFVPQIGIYEKKNKKGYLVQGEEVSEILPGSRFEIIPAPIESVHFATDINTDHLEAYERRAKIGKLPKIEFIWEVEYLLTHRQNYYSYSADKGPTGKNTDRLKAAIGAYFVANRIEKPTTTDLYNYFAKRVDTGEYLRERRFVFWDDMISAVREEV